MKQSAFKLIEFPKDRIIRPPLEEAVQQRIQVNTKMFYDMVIMDEGKEMVQAFAAAGVNVQDPDFARRFSFGMEVMRAAIYSDIGQEHPVNNIVDTITAPLKASFVQEASLLQEQEE